MKKIAVLGFIMGMFYFTAEGFWRGWTNISMLFVGGICAVLIGLLNESTRHNKLKIWQQSILGTLIIVAIEFISGLILNVWLKLNIWDYSKHYGNIMGQVCLTYTILWFVITPAVIWLDDWLRYKIFGEGIFYDLKQVYRDLIKFQ